MISFYLDLAVQLFSMLSRLPFLLTVSAAAAEEQLQDWCHLTVSVPLVQCPSLENPEYTSCSVLALVVPSYWNASVFKNPNDLLFFPLKSQFIASFELPFFKKNFHIKYCSTHNNFLSTHSTLYFFSTFITAGNVISVIVYCCLSKIYALQESRVLLLLSFLYFFQYLGLYFSEHKRQLPLEFFCILLWILASK